MSFVSGNLHAVFVSGADMWFPLRVREIRARARHRQLLLSPTVRPDRQTVQSFYRPRSSVQPSVEIVRSILIRNFEKTI